MLYSVGLVKTIHTIRLQIHLYYSKKYFLTNFLSANSLLYCRHVRVLSEVYNGHTSSNKPHPFYMKNVF
jgi:hypothetical protein